VISMTMMNSARMVSVKTYKASFSNNRLWHPSVSPTRKSSSSQSLGVSSLPAPVRQKYLVIGLGNPGAEFDGTRHNVGFEFVDYFVARWTQDRAWNSSGIPTSNNTGTMFKSMGNCLVHEFQLEFVVERVVKPQTERALKDDVEKDPRLVKKMKMMDEKASASVGLPTTKLKRIIGSVMVAKPQTFMNLSGDGLQMLLQKHRARNDHILVLYDDINLDLGGVRYVVMTSRFIGLLSDDCCFLML
jgi:peptidyl-tRNA hydrolase